MTGGPGPGSSGSFEVLCHVHTRFYINVEKLPDCVSDLLFEFTFFHGLFTSFKSVQNNITLQRPRQVTNTTTLRCTPMQDNFLQSLPVESSLTERDSKN